MMTPILALDFATSTGWAARDRYGMITYGAQTFRLGRGESQGMRFLRLRAWLQELSTLLRLRPNDGFAERPTYGPGLLAWEKPHHRGGAATELCVGMRTIAIAHAAAQRLDHTEVHTASLKMHATGKGNAGKAAMIIAAQKRWDLVVGVLREDEADALCVLSWAADEIGSDL